MMNAGKQEERLDSNEIFAHIQQPYLLSLYISSLSKLLKILSTSQGCAPSELCIYIYFSSHTLTCSRAKEDLVHRSGCAPKEPGMSHDVIFNIAMGYPFSEHADSAKPRNQTLFCMGTREGLGKRRHLCRQPQHIT